MLEATKNMETQIELLYCHYGMTPNNVAKTLQLPPTYVMSVIEENELMQPTVEALVPEVINETDDSNGQDDMISTLQTRELHKQSMLAPLAAVTEITIMAKLCDAVKHLDASDPGTANALSSLTKSYKMLVQDAIAHNALLENAKNSGDGGISINVQTYNG